MDAFQLVWHDDIGDIRIMAFAEGYVMARRRGCMPFLLSLIELSVRFHPGAKDA